MNPDLAPQHVPAPPRLEVLQTPGATWKFGDYLASIRFSDGERWIVGIPFQGKNRFLTADGKPLAPGSVEARWDILREGVEAMVRHSPEKLNAVPEALQSPEILAAARGGLALRADAASPSSFLQAERRMIDAQLETNSLEVAIPPRRR